MNAKSFRVMSSDNIEAALADATSNGFKPTLAFVFMSVGPDIPSVCQPFNARGIQIFGAHTHGEFVGNDLGANGIAILLLELDESAFHLSSWTLAPGSEHDTMVSMAREAQSRFSNPSFLLVSSHLETVAEDLLAGIESVIGPEANVFGAMAGMDLTTYEHAVFTGESIQERGVITLVIDSAVVSVDGIATCGWKPVGSVKTVTKSDGMWVHEIDGQPALDLMLKYAGIDLATLTQETWINEYGTALPPQLIREEGANVMRPSLAYGIDMHDV